MKSLVLLLLLSVTPALAQKRVLVAPGGDAIPLGKNQSAVEALKRNIAMVNANSSGACTNKATFGFTFEQNQGANTNHIGFHQDIMAMWYVAPASGSIDTIFWFQTDLGSLDSTVTLRVFNSNIYPGSGPGYDGYPSPGRLCWGYFISTNDFDNGLAAYPEDATDPDWVSTVSGPTPSFPAFGGEIWGLGAFPKIADANAINSVAMEDLQPLDVTVGQPFFIALKIFGPHVAQAEESQTGFLAVNEAESLQTHNWKFYEHIVEIQPGFTCPGWVARGDFNILIWYSMTVTTNVPPVFSNITDVNTTLDTSPQTVQADIIDCNPDTASPVEAGVKSALLRYARNGVPQADITMFNIGGDTWEAEIPGGSVDDVISYRLVASDSSDFADSTGTQTYRIVALSTEWYTADTGAVCTDRDIRTTGTWVDTASFFVPGFTTTPPRDDGTSGPYDMGADFTLFGDEFRYAWIGVNGAIALSKTATDTLDVNSNGFATTLWDFPNGQKAGRTDTANASDMPGMFIAPFWADHIVGDTAAEYGRIVYGDDGDTCLFITEWDSIGAFATTGPIPDITTFRVVLNRCEGTVEYQYVSVGTTGLDSAGLVGMQADSSTISGPVPGWIFVNRNTYPIQTKPRDNWCVRLVPHVATGTIDGWNILAVSLAPISGNYAKNAIFPGTGSAYKYSNGYVVEDTLEHGAGYWIKVEGGGAVGTLPGTFISCVSVPVVTGWNIIGGPSGIAAVADITENGTTVTSSYFGYGDAGYFTASDIWPGHGYWVKVSGPGTLDMCSGGSAAPKMAATNGPEGVTGQVNSVTIYDAAGRSQTLYLADKSRLSKGIGFYEMPPAPPAGIFDVRFESQRYLEALPAGKDGQSAFPIAISGAAWPVGVRWEIGSPPGSATLTLRNADGVVHALEGSGTLLLQESSVKGLAIALTDGGAVPATFALSQNYPNPFNPVTNFTVDIAAEAETEVAIFDVLGRKIATLLAGMKPAGTYALQWDGVDAGGVAVPTGMYMVRMTAGEFTASRKIMLMK